MKEETLRERFFLSTFGEALLGQSHGSVLLRPPPSATEALNAKFLWRWNIDCPIVCHFSMGKVPETGKGSFYRRGSHFGGFLSHGVSQFIQVIRRFEPWKPWWRPMAPPWQAWEGQEDRCRRCGWYRWCLEDLSIAEVICEDVLYMCVCHDDWK